jgi:hypothetical protein
VSDRDEPLVAYRFVNTDDRNSSAFVDCFKSDQAAGKPARGRQRSDSTLHDS